MGSERKRVVMVSSTVYGIEEFLDRVYALLTGFGYEVWMSHKGTMPVTSERSNFENCIRAVEACDLFLGVITPYYGSGVDSEGISICHSELRRAIELDKPRWLLAHDHVVFARKLIGYLGYPNADKRKRLKLKTNHLFGDLRVIDMYEEATRDGVPLSVRQGNWVQQFRSDEDASLFVTAQFSRYQEAEAFIEENFAGKPSIAEPANDISEATRGY